MQRFSRITWMSMLSGAILFSNAATGAHADSSVPVHPLQPPPPRTQAVGVQCAACTPFTPVIPEVGSMLITGPLDDYVGECLQGCADPWSNNHSITALTPLSATPPAINVPHAASLALATASPTFKVKLEFDSNGSSPGSTDQPYPGVSGVRRGDVANFDATLERCDAPQTQDPNSPAPVFPDCIDYASNTGNWQPAGSNAVAIGLPSVNAGGLEELQVTDSTPFDLGRPPALPVPGLKIPVDPGVPPDLARTYRLQLHTYLQQTPALDPTSVGNNTRAEDTRYTAPFDVALSPVATFEGKVLPYTLLYQPPGNMSSPGFTLTTAYGTQFQAGGSSTVSSSMTDDQNLSIQAALRLGMDVSVGQEIQAQFGGGIDIGQTRFWDHTTQLAMGTTATTDNTLSSNAATTITWRHPANVSLVPGSGQMCTFAVPSGATRPSDYQYTCSPPEVPTFTVSNERNPFEAYWQDEFALTVHPQFAVWSANGQTRELMTGSAAFVTVPLYQLNDCALGVRSKTVNPCHLEYADPGVTIQNRLNWLALNASVDVTPAEAAGLLRLDPFYMGGSQAAALDPGRAVLVKALGGYGLSVEDDQHNGTPLDMTLAKSYGLGTDFGSALSREYDMTVTDTVGSSTFGGLDINMAGTGGKVTVTSGESRTTMNQVRMVFTDSTTVSTTTTTTSEDSISDEDRAYQSQQGSDCKTCHDPLQSRPSVAVYADRQFGTLMFQDPNAPVAPCGSLLFCTHITDTGALGTTGAPAPGTTGVRIPLVPRKSLVVKP